MKKVFALMMVSAFAVAIVACGGKKEETSETAVDTTVVTAPIVVDTTAADTTATDTTAAQ